MKRLTAILIAGIFVLAPLSASAMEMMEDSSMKDVTGQAGVSIALDDVVLFQDVGYNAYIDTDGIGDDNPAAVLITDRYSLQTINAIAPADLLEGAGETLPIGDLQSNYTYNSTGIEEFDDIGSEQMPSWNASPLTIDVGTAELVSVADQLNEGAGGINGVIIGLPTVEIHATAESYDVGVVSAAGGTADKTAFDDLADSDRIIRVETGESTTAVLGGHLEIAPH